MNTLHFDGGPAFPIMADCSQNTATGETTVHQVTQLGMTLRDYFAIHGSEPRLEQVCMVAGIRADGDRRIVYPTPESRGMRFEDWWASLEMEQQLDLLSAVRYAAADAMLRARQA